MASLEIESQTFIPQEKILRSEMVLAHVSGTSMPGPKPDPPAPAPCPSLHFQFLGKAVQSSSGILFLPSSHAQCQHRLLTLGPGAIPDSSSAGLALTHTQETLDKKPRDGPDCVWATRSLSFFGKGQPRPRQDRLWLLDYL